MANKDLEQAPLLNENEETAPSSTHSRVWKLIAGACLLGGALVAGVGSFKHNGKTVQENRPSASSSTELQGVNNGADYKGFVSGSDTDGWIIYKVAWPGHDDDVDRILEFMTDHSGGTDCAAVNLGCEGFKITCNYIMKQIHYVVAPALLSSATPDDGYGVNGWIEKTTASFGDMTTFEPFMHDKVQIFIEDVVAKAKELEAADHVVMRRSSLVWEDNADGTNVRHTIGHTMVVISGKIWDFVGEIEEPAVAEAEGFVKWRDDECPIAHEIRGASFADLRKYISDYKESILVSIQIATSSLDSKGVTQMTGALKGMTGVNEVEVRGEYCDVKVFHYLDRWEELTGGGFGDQVYMKFVVNHEHQVSTANGLSVSDYEDYIYQVHEKYLTGTGDGDPTHRWRMWDHWLDQHVGVMYGGTSMIEQYEQHEGIDDNALTDKRSNDYWKEMDAKCLEMSKEVTETLIDQKQLVGKREVLTDGDHYYVGYEGLSMTIEYNTECHYGQDGTTDLCTCVSTNSDRWALDHLESYDVRYQECAIILQTMDGASVTGTADVNHDTTGAEKPN
jgi:hypothetical protein